MNSLSSLVSSADDFCKQFGPQIMPTKTSGLIWIQSVDTQMVFLKEIFEKVNFEKKIS